MLAPVTVHATHFKKRHHRVVLVFDLQSQMGIELPSLSEVLKWATPDFMIFIPLLNKSQCH